MAPADEAAQRDDWDRHWLDYSDAAELNPAQRYRRRIVFDLLALGEGPARVLDVGSGQGDFAAELLRRHPHAELLGLEVSEAGIDIARRKAAGAEFVQRDLTQPGEPEAQQRGWATHAVCSEVLEHVDQPAELIANAAGYMAPGCRLVVTVPGGPMSAFDRHIGHRRHFSPSALRGLLEGAGFEVEKAGGAGFPFFNLYRLVVILRGRKLVDDVTAAEGGSDSRLAAAVMSVFRLAFRLNLPLGRLGWQTVAVARRPAQEPSGSR
ncbi:MAG: class I SAM-dependent methyltransferase [Actinomycetota bacterium]